MKATQGPWLACRFIVWEKTSKFGNNEIVSVARNTSHLRPLQRPGMLAAVAERIAGKDMSIENVETQLRMHGDEREFVVDASVSSKKPTDRENLKELIDDMSLMKEELGLDILNIRVQGVAKEQLQ